MNKKDLENKKYSFYSILNKNESPQQVVPSKLRIRSATRRSIMTDRKVIIVYMDSDAIHNN